MNIFILDPDPIKAAQNLCDKHVVKMCLETAQILSTVNGGPYRTTHQNHPCTIWARSNIENYKWLVLHGIGIANEYEYRFDKEHKCKEVIECLEEPLIELSPGFTKFALAMPEEYKSDNAVYSYREYYKSKKLKFDMKYTKREKPEWL